MGDKTDSIFWVRASPASTTNVKISEPFKKADCPQLPLVIQPEDELYDRESVHALLGSFAKNVSSTHGLPHVFKSTTLFSRAIWATLFLVGVSMFIWQIATLIILYIGYPVNVKIEVVSRSEQLFPSVTICNNNKVRKSSIANSEHRQLLIVDKDTSLPYYAPCLPDDFVCGSGEICIKQYLRCDGINHCRDFSDEQGCTYGDCRSDVLYKCSNGSASGVCIDISHKCDRIKDCYDGEDEDECECKVKEFKCVEHGGCIDKKLVCDNTTDCTDGSDEEGCDINCTDGWKCLDDACIPHSYRCDGYKDCRKGEDELEENCIITTTVAPACSVGQFQCLNLECITGTWVCDFEQDCSDGSDELDCWGSFVESCNSWEFACANGVQCIIASWECDGYGDCWDSSDEIECECNGFTCVGSGICLPRGWKCDTWDDCDDASDEADCNGEYYIYSSDSSGPESQGSSDGESVPDSQESSDDASIPDSQGSSDGESAPDSQDSDGVSTPESQGSSDGESVPDSQESSDGVSTPGSQGSPDGESDSGSDGSTDGVSTNGPQGSSDGESAPDSQDSDGVSTPGSQVSSDDESAPDLQETSDSVSTPGSQGSSDGESAPDSQDTSDGVGLSTPGSQGSSDDESAPDSQETSDGVSTPGPQGSSDGESDSGSDGSTDGVSTLGSQGSSDGESTPDSRDSSDGVTTPGSQGSSDGESDSGSEGSTVGVSTPGSQGSSDDESTPDSQGSSDGESTTASELRSFVEPTTEISGSVDVHPESSDSESAITPEGSSDTEDESGRRRRQANGGLVSSGGVFNYLTTEYIGTNGTSTEPTTNVESTVEPTCAGGFSCLSGECLESWMECNNYPDCSDGSDEYLCGSVDSMCNPGEIKCRGEERCIDALLECNGEDDCLFNSDETESYCSRNSTEVVCPDKYFMCDSGKCIHEYSKCNSVFDCFDMSDERDCIHSDIEAIITFETGWHESYIDITNDEDIYNEFIDAFYKKRDFERVKGEVPPDWYGFMSFSSTPDYSDLEDVLKLTKDEIEDHGHQANDFILQCTFDQNQCSIRDFIHFENDAYGNCFIFNHGQIGEPVRNSTRTGAKFGLKLTLFTEQEEYISIYGGEAGVRVVVDSSDRLKFPEDEGITIRPGVITSLSLRYNVVTKLGHPYGNCSSDGNERYHDMLNQAYGVNKYVYGYDRKSCEKSCVLVKIKERCECSDAVSLKGERCRVLNRDQDICKQLMYFFYQRQLLGCDCKQQCSEQYYSKTVSQSLWPSEVYLKHLLKSIHNINKKTNGLNDMASVRENIARLAIYFEELNFESTVQEPAYQVESLFSDIGGTAGLYIGISFISFCEFIELVFQLLKQIKRYHSVGAKNSRCDDLKV